MGSDSKASNSGATAVGSNSTAGAANSTAIGTNSNASANDGDVALGAGSTTSKAVGTSSTKIGDTTYNFAGGNATSTVSVGSAGDERTITNVAAGQLNASSTDAVNGSQLYSTNQAIDQIAQTANKGWNVSTDGSTSNNVGPGGTVTMTSSDNNLVISQTGSGGNATINYSLSNNLNIANSVSVSGGATVMNGTGFYVTGGPSITKDGINAGGKVVTGVADGAITATSTDAVNGSQIFALDQGISNLQRQVSNNLNEARAGISQAMAASSLRYDDRPGKVSAAAGMAVYHNSVGMAAGIGWTSEDARWRANVAGTYSAGAAKPDFGIMGGLSYTFN